MRVGHARLSPMKTEATARPNIVLPTSAKQVWNIGSGASR